METRAWARRGWRGVVVGLALAATSAAAAPAEEAALMRPIHAYIDAVNAGHPMRAAGAFTADVIILDEIEPYAWQGPNALAGWTRAFLRDAATYGLTDEHSVLGAPTRADVAGDKAYVVVPEALSYVDHGRPMCEAGQHVFNLRKVGGAWKISAAAWTGAPLRPGACPPP